MPEVYRVRKPGDSSFYPGQIVSVDEFNRTVAAIIQQGGEPPLGILIKEPSPEKPVIVLVEDITNISSLDYLAKRLGGKLESFDPREHSALFSLPTKGAASDFMFFARQQGYQAAIYKPTFLGIFNPLDALREDAERIRRAMKKPPVRPPWAQ